MDFDNLTIVRYLMSWNDDPTRRREDFMDPEKQFGKECGYCRRTCDMLKTFTYGISKKSNLEKSNFINKLLISFFYILRKHL